MSERAFFVSDIHLGSSSEPNALLLLEFLRSFQSTSEITHLFLVGDIFDLWIGKYDYFTDKYRLLIRELERLVKLGVNVHYFEGNHDLYLNHFFGKKLGLKVHDGPKDFRIGNRNIRVEHGDEMNPDDKGYLLLRRILRSRFFKWLATRLPETFVVWFGNHMSRMSRVYTTHVNSISNEKVKKVIRSHAQRLLDNGEEFDLLIAGHVHVVDDVEIRSAKQRKLQVARVINLGSWHDVSRVFYVEEHEARFLDLK